MSQTPPSRPDETSGAARTLPPQPSLEFLRKEAKQLVQQQAGLKLATAQHQLAQAYGFKNWAALSQHVRNLRGAPPPSPRIDSPTFRQAVAAIDQGDLERLDQLLQTEPELALAQAEEAGEYAGSYFQHPHLLEFIAENPVRQGRLPSNILEITQRLIDAGSPQLAIDKTLGLVVSGRVVRECGVQGALTRLLVDNGAEPGPALKGAISQSEFDAAHLLLELGAPLTLHAAAGLGRIEFVRDHLSGDLKQQTLAAAFDAAVKGDHPAVAELLLDAGLRLDTPIPGHPAEPTLLHQAANFGRDAIVDLLLRRGADVGVREKQWGGTPAGWAEHGGHLALAEKLSERDLLGRVTRAVYGNDVAGLEALLEAHPEALGFRVGQWHKPLLHTAAWEGHLEMVKMLLQKGVEVNERCESDHACAIHFAAERGRLEIVRALADAGADLEAPDNDHQQSVLGWAVSMGSQPEVAQFLLARGVPHTIWTAVAMGDREAVKELVRRDPTCLEARMSRNEFHRTPLLHAIERGRPEMVALLRKLGADPHARDSLELQVTGGESASEEGILAALETRPEQLTLGDALALRRFEEAERLLARDPDAIRPGGTLSHLFVYAVVRRDWEAAQWLLDRGGDVNAIAEVYGCPATALHFLVENDPADRIDWLLEHGADASIADGKYEADAVGWAEFFGKPELAAKLRAAR